MLKWTLFGVLALSVLFSQAQTNQTKIDAIVQMGHAQYITCSDLSDNGELAVTGSGDNSIILWDAINGKQIRTFNVHYKSIRSVNFNPNNSLIISTSKDNSLKVIDVKTGQIKHAITFSKQTIYNAYFSQDGSKFITLNDRDAYTVWSTEKGKDLGTFKKDFGGLKDELLISPDGTKVLSKVNWATVACIELNLKDTLFTMPFDKAFTMNFSENGNYIAIGSSKLFSKVFDAKTGKELHYFKSDSEKGCDGCGTLVKISPNEKYVFSISSKKDGILWNLKSGKQIKKFGDFEKRPTNIAFTANEKFLLISSVNQVYVYDIESGKLKLKLDNKWIRYYEVKFQKSHHQFILPSKNNIIDIWDAQNGRKIKTLKGYLNQQRADGLKYDYTDYYDKTILHYISLKNNVSINPKGTQFAIGKIDSSVVIIDVLTGKKIKIIKHHQVILAHDFSPNGKWLALGSGDGEIKIYNTTNYALSKTLTGHQSLIFDVKFSYNSQQLVSGSWDGTMKVWNIANQKAIQTIDLGGFSPYLVRFSPKDLYVLSGDLGKDIKFWEIDSKTAFRSLIGHTKTISGIEFSPNQRHMLTSSWDGKVKVWDILTGMLIGKLATNNTPVYSVQYSANGKQIISGSADKMIYISDALTLQNTDTLKGHTSAVSDIKMSQNGKYLISRGANGEVFVWDYLQKKEIYTYFQINENDWLVKNPNGYFDGSPNALKLVNYVSGTDVISINSLFDKYYTPHLVKRLMAGDQLFDSGQNLNKIIDHLPQIEFQFASTQKREINIKEDSVYQSKSKTFNVQVSILENEKSIDEIRVYNNGKLLENQSWQKNMSFRGGGNIQSFDIELVNGVNDITAIAISDNKTESNPIKLSVAYNNQATNSDLYVFSIGINTYKNAAYNLSYAVKDANDFSKAIVKGADTLFDHIYEYELRNSAVNTAQIVETFKSILPKIEAEDVFVFYYAGHGVMSLGDKEDFYLVAHNVINLYGDQSLLEQEGLSATALMGFSRQIAAQKQLFILDACHSGGALNSFATRGDGREKAIAQLARNTGTFFLTASQDVQYANESGDLKHGLFTYALLEILKGESFASALDGKITINEIKTYVEERVPELSQKYHGSAQYPTSYSFGQDFPIVILK